MVFRMLNNDIYGVATKGYGLYNSSNHKHAFQVWLDMLRRCYDLKFQQTHPSYKNCTVCKEWLNFQNFVVWYDAISKGHSNWQIDKDIRCKNNKIYSPETCLIIPQRINLLIIRRQGQRGEYPIGVRFLVRNKSRPYEARLKTGKGRYVSLGTFETAIEAFESYKAAKEQLIQKIANEYRNDLSDIAYQSLLNYKVDIND